MTKADTSILNPWIVCQIGAREHYAIPRALHRAGSLSLVLTDFWVPPGSLVSLLLPDGKCFRRWNPDLSNACVNAPNWWSLARFVKGRIDKFFGRLYLGESNTRFQKSCLDSLDDWQEPSGVESVTLFSFSYAARDLFRYAKSRGWKTVLGQIDLGAYEEGLVAAEHARYPNSGSTHKFADEAYWASWREELDLADRIIVNSPWALEGLKHENVDFSKVEIIPLVYAGEDLPDRGPSLFPSMPVGKIAAPHGNPGNLRLLFLGNICLRKGVGRLIDAMRIARGLPVQLDLYGNLEVDPGLWADLPNVQCHAPVKNSGVGAIFRSADVFILPSISDGFALTQLEALKAGTPVIASRQCGEVVIDGVNGILLQENSPEEIVAVLRRLVDNREVLDRLDPTILPPGLPRGLDDLAARLLRAPTHSVSSSADFATCAKPSPDQQFFGTTLFKSIGLVAIVGLLFFFTFRGDSSFQSISWIPTSLTKFLEKYIYLRNFWGFLPMGLFIGLAYRVGAVPWKDGRVRWVVVGLLMLPVVKELVQIPMPQRHCNLIGMLAGVAGMWLGLWGGGGNEKRKWES